MGIPTSEVGYTSAMPRREDHEVRKGYVGGGGIGRKKNNDWIYRTPQISGFVRLCTVTEFTRLRKCQFFRLYTMIEYTGRRKYQGLSDYVQWLEYTGRCKFQDFSDYVQWLNISDAANFRIYPNMYSDWRQYTGRHSFHLCSSMYSKCKRRQNWTMF